MRRQSLQIPLVCLLAACAKQPVRPGAALPEAPAERLAAVRAAEDRVQTLRARFTSVTHLPSGERSADGVLLVAKPDRFRLRLMLPIGITVFDFLSVGDQTWIVSPFAEPNQPGGDEAFAAFSREDLGAAFLRGPYAFPGACAAAPAGDGEVAAECTVDGTRRRSLRIGRAGISEETSFGDRGARLRIRYGDYRDVDGVAVPFRITLDYPQRNQSVDITIDTYEVNPVLPATAFAPPPDTPPRRS